MPEGQAVEAGVGAHGIFGGTTAAVGADGYVEGQLLPPGAVAGWGAVQLVARGSATDFFPYSNAKLFSDVLAEGTGGVRTSYSISQTLYIGGEVLGGYEWRQGQEQSVILSAGMPVAEAATPDIWVYTDPTIGLIARVGGDPCSHGIPFCGYTEVPLGITWRVTPWFLLSGEGGLSVPLQPGGYVAVAAAFRL